MVGNAQSGGSGPDRGGLESTASLLFRVRNGDESAREDLIRRFLPSLQRWARGRLPPYGRDLADTDDLVQNTLLRALDRIEEFEPLRVGAFMAYLRRILGNQVRDEIRRSGRRPRMESVTSALPALQPSPLEEAVGRQTLGAYEAALDELTPEQREAVVLKIELGLSNPELADALQSSSVNAARMFATRAVLRLAELMREKDMVG